MIKTNFTGLCRPILISVLAWSMMTSAIAADDREVAIADQIRLTFEAALPTFPPDIQEHFAVRMYRISGDDKYLPPILHNVSTLIRQLETDADSLLNDDFAARRTGLLLHDFDGKSRKNRYRKWLFEKSDAMLAYLDCLHNCAKLTDYRRPGSYYDSVIAKTGSLLRTIDFSSFLTNHDVIRHYGAQAVNYVYDLYYLGIADIRSEYALAFREVFPDCDDAMLSPLEYKDKIYGLTHIIFAASRYYQQFVDSTEFRWILEYFEGSIDRILGDTKEDIIAEVGICLLLAGNTNNTVIQRCREVTLEGFDKKRGMIPSVSEDFDLEKGEHRNVLAIMLLKWPEKLYSGPYLEEKKQFQEIFPEK